MKYVLDLESLRWVSSSFSFFCFPASIFLRFLDFSYSIRRLFSKIQAFKLFGLCPSITYFLIPIPKFPLSQSLTTYLLPFGSSPASPEFLEIRPAKMSGRPAASGVDQKKVVVIEYDKIRGTYLELGFWDDDIGAEKYAEL